MTPVIILVSNVLEFTVSLIRFSSKDAVIVKNATNDLRIPYTKDENIFLVTGKIISYFLKPLKAVLTIQTIGA